MNSKADLDEDINEIWMIYTKTYEYFYCLKQIVNYKRSEYTNSRFVSFLSYTSWYVLVIDLCKVFQNDNKTQHYNVYGLINKLKNNYKNLEYKSLLTKSEIEKFYSDFNSPRIIDIRNKLVLLRDKFYAHTDRNSESFVNNINLTLIEVESLFILLQNFIFDIKSKVFGGHTVFEDDIFLKIEKILQNNDDSNKRRREEMIRNALSEMNKHKNK